MMPAALEIMLEKAIDANWSRVQMTYLPKSFFGLHYWEVSMGKICCVKAYGLSMRASKKNFIKKLVKKGVSGFWVDGEYGEFKIFMPKHLAPKPSNDS